MNTAWESERALIYLASGKPCVVQYTGPSTFLPDDERIFRFRSLEEARHCLAEVENDYPAHRLAARRLAESFFDSASVIPRFLDLALV